MHARAKEDVRRERPKPKKKGPDFKKMTGKAYMEYVSRAGKGRI